MRTERAVFLVRIFFAYWNGHIFYTHGHSANSFVTPKFCPTFAMSIRDNKAPKSMIALTYSLIKNYNHE